MKEQQTYQVGQIIYALHKKTGKLEPVQIFEIIIKQGLGYDIKTSYMVKHISDTEICDMSSMHDNYIYFSSLEEAHTDLIERARVTVAKLTSHAHELAQKHFPHLQQQTQEQSPPAGDDSGEWIAVDIGNGQTARMRKPSQA